MSAFIMICLFFMGLVLASMTTHVLGQTPTVATPLPPMPSRIAVISTEDRADLATLVTTELSSNPEISLVERDDLAKIGDEVKLQQLAGTDAVALGKLVGSDGLIFISKGPTGFQVRFTAVGLGYALFDDQVGSQTDMPQLAKSIVHRVIGYTSKLKLDPAKAIPISVLNLRADYATSTSTVLERNLTLLLERRLASLPEYVVLERRHAWSLGFERSLEPTNQPLLHGTYVVDGALTLPAQSKSNVTARLRLRTPDGHETNETTEGLSTDLPGLVDKMVTEIQKTTGSGSTPLAGSSENEAHEYLLEGLWGWQHHADDAALEALDSAELLGGNIADVTAIRVLVLSDLVNKGMEIWYPQLTSQNKPSIAASQLVQKTDDAIRAIEDVTRYRDEKLESRLQAFRSVDPEMKYDFTTQGEEEVAVFPISKLLVLLDDAKAPRADDLRKALRSVTGYDPLRGQRGHQLSARMNEWDCGELFADNWAQSLDEELAYYDIVSTNQDPLLFSAIANNPSDKFCARFLKTPKERQKAFDQFLESLKGKADLRMTYLILKTYAKDQATADSAYQDILGELWNKREDLAAARTSNPLLNSLHYVSSKTASRGAEAGLPLLHYALTTPKIGSAGICLPLLLWHPENFPEPEASTLWAQFNDYRNRLGAVWNPQDYAEILSFRMEQMSGSFTAKFPELAKAPASVPTSGSEALVVTKFWCPWLSTNWRYAYFGSILRAADDNGLWLVERDSGEPYTLFRVSLPDFATQLISLPDKHQLETLAVTSEAVYMTLEENLPNNSGILTRQIGRYDLKTSTWTTHALPDCANCSLYGLEDSLYLFLVIDPRAQDSIITRYDWSQDKLTILSSTRRRPAQNQFDDRFRLHSASIFLGPGHKPAVTTIEGTFYMQEGPGPWPEVFNGSFGEQSITFQGKTLVLSQSGEATLLDPKAVAPEYLMAPSEPQVRKWSPDAPPVKELAPWAKQTIWDLPAGENVWPSAVAFSGDDLFILRKPTVKGGNYDLLCYEKGKGRNPRHIPLKFQLDDQARSVLSKKPDGAPATWNIDQIEHPDSTIFPDGEVEFFATEQGLCIQPHNVGFWFIPYRDIEGYLKAPSDKPVRLSTHSLNPR